MLRLSELVGNVGEGGELFATGGAGLARPIPVANRTRHLVRNENNEHIPI